MTADMPRYLGLTWDHPRGYRALEAADSAWKATQQVDVSQLESMLEGLLAKQLVAAVSSAAAT